MLNEDNGASAINAPSSNINQPTMASEIPGAAKATDAPIGQPVIQGPPKKKSKADIIIGVIVALLIIASIAIALIFIPKLFGQNDNTYESKRTSRTPEKETYNAYEKLTAEYESGAIGVAEYFEQLVYLETDSSKLDPLYEADDGSTYGVSHFDEICDFIRDNYSSLDKDLVQQYIDAQTQASYNFGTESENEVGQATDIKLAAEEKERSIKQRYFTEVLLSSKGNFLIWYTKEGDDKITDEQAKNIATTLEDNVDAYNKLFGINYSFRKNDETTVGSRALKAQGLLKKKGIDHNKLFNTMSVYVYDTQSKDTLASHITFNDVNHLKTLVSSIRGIYNDDDYVTVPYIKIDRQVTEDPLFSSQIVNHEFAHHYQYLYCHKVANTDCQNVDSNGYKYVETIAQFASAAISKPYDKGYLANFASGFSEFSYNGLYSPNNATGDNLRQSYRDYPYIISYLTEAGGKINDVLDAHVHADPLGYLKSKSSYEQLHTAIVKTAGYIISNKYPSKYQTAVSGNFAGPKFNKIETLGALPSLSLNPGAIVFYELSEGTLLHAKSSNNLTSYVLFDENKNEVWRSDDTEVDIDSGICYKTGSKCYLAYANGDIANSSTLSTIVNSLNAPRTFNTAYENYRLKINMQATVGGITVKTSATGVMDELHQREHLNVTSETMGMDITNEIFTDSHENVSYTSMPDVGLGDLSGLIGDDYSSWIKSNDANYYTDLGLFLEKIESGADGVKKIDDNHYIVTINVKDIQGLVGSNGESVNGVQMPDKSIEASVTVNGGYITQIDYDFSNISIISNFKASIEISDYNQAGSVYIPLTIKRDAKTSE